MRTGRDRSRRPGPDLSTLFVGAKLINTEKLTVAFAGELQAAYAQLANLEVPQLVELVVTKAKEPLAALKKVFGKKMRFFYD